MGLWYRYDQYEAIRGKFVRYVAKGYIYDRDQTGKRAGIKRIVHCDGVVKAGPEMLGSIFRQQAELLPCDRVNVDIYTI